MPLPDAAAPAGVEAALAEAQAKIAELQESFLRAKAETENVRRRAQEDVSKAHKFAIESFAEHLLPVVDSLEAAVAHSSDDLQKVREGVELTLRQLNGALEKGRVVALNPGRREVRPASSPGYFDGACRAGAEHGRRRAAKGLCDCRPRAASGARHCRAAEVSAGSH